MDLDMILKTLNIPYDTRESGSKLIYRIDCPYCHRSLKHKDYSGALFPSYNNLTYSCFRGCKPVSGGAFRVLSDVSGYSLSEIYMIVSEYSTAPIKDVEIQHKISVLHAPEDIGLTDRYRNYLKNRGFIPEEVTKKYRLLFTPHKNYFYNNNTSDKSLYLSNRIIFPVYNDKSQFVSFTGRDIEKDSQFRYIFPKRSWCPVDAKDIGFGIRGKKDIAVIVEGAVDACKMPNSIACLGIKYSPAFVNYIISNYKKAVVIFDPNESRAKASQKKMIRELSIMMDVVHYKYPYGWDLGDCTKSEIERICNDLDIDMDTRHLHKDWRR